MCDSKRIKILVVIIINKLFKKKPLYVQGEIDFPADLEDVLKQFSLAKHPWRLPFKD